MVRSVREAALSCPICLKACLRADHWKSDNGGGGGGETKKKQTRKTQPKEKIINNILE